MVTFLLGAFICCLLGVKYLYDDRTILGTALLVSAWLLGSAGFVFWWLLNFRSTWGWWL